ncbi:hypothetical protein LCGC14_0422290 [marine sediment metagenome]|uniref:Uncharacterized protein n=1 Tax=marine sediment metagenome TaxID=412755 RepID=A0A0F9SWR9_9ZZZZ
MEFLEGKFITITRTNPFEELKLTDSYREWYDSLDEAIKKLEEEEASSTFPVRYEETVILKVEKVIINIDNTKIDIKAYRIEDAKKKIQELENIDWRTLTLNEVKYIAALRDYIDGRRDEYPKRTRGIG